MCKIHIHIVSTHSVLLDILTIIYTQYVHIYIYTHTLTCEGAADFTQAGYAMSWMCVAWYPVVADRLLCYCSVCVCVVQLNCVKVQYSAYRNVGVCCISFYCSIAWGKKWHILKYDTNNYLVCKKISKTILTSSRNEIGSSCCDVSGWNEQQINL